MNTAQSPPLIVHIVYSLGTGGLENGLVNLINRTPAGRYRHTVICLTSAGPFAARIQIPGVDVYEMHKKPGHGLGVYVRLLKRLRQLQPAIIHTRNLAALEMQFVALLVPGAKRIQGEHGRDVHDLDGTSKKYNLLRKLLKPIIHRYIAVSRDLAEWLQSTIKVPPRKIRQIYNGVARESFYPAKDRQREDGRLVVGSVGRLAAVKNQVSLINAVGILLKHNPVLKNSLSVVIVGDGPMESQLRQKIDELDLGDIIRLTGNREDIPDVLRTMDLFVLPSLAEGISNTVLEAMATGLPVIATNTGGNPELVDDRVTGLLVPVANDEALASAMSKLLDDADARSHMGKMGMEKVCHLFNWSRTVDEYLAVYDEVLGRRSEIHEGTAGIQHEGGEQ